MSHRRPWIRALSAARRPPPRLAACAWALAAGVALLLAAPAGAAEKVTIQLQWQHQFQFAGYYAAQDKGYYRDAGLDVSLLEAAPGANPIENVMDGHAQYGVGNSSLLLARGLGQPVVVLASIFQHSPAVLLVRRDADGKRRPWPGSRVMLAQNNEELTAYFKRIGVRLESMFLMPHTYDLEELVSGKVDAYAGYATEEPFLLERSGLNYEMISPRSVGIDFYSDNLYTTESELREHPARVQAMREATLRGWQYAMAHQGEIADLIRARYPNRHSREQLIFEAQQTVPLLEQGLIELGYSNPERWRSIAHTYIELGMLPPDFSLKGFLYEPDTAHPLWRYGALGALALLLLLGAGAAWRSRRLTQALRGAEGRVDSAEQMAAFALEATGQGVWDWLIEERRATYAARYGELLGYAAGSYAPTIDEWVGQVHPDDLERVGQHMAGYSHDSTDRAAVLTCEFRLRCADGSWKWVLGRGMVVQRGADGRALRAIGTISDISERAAADHARVSAILDATPAAMMVADKTGTVHFANPACLRSFGYDHHQLVGRSIDQLVPDAMRHTGRARELHSRPHLPGRVLSAQRADGSHFPAMVHLSPLRLSGQDLTVVSLRDMTQRQRAEEALHASSERYRLIVQTAAEGIWMTDADARTSFVNPTMARMLGHGVEQMLGRPMGDFMDENGRALLLEQGRRPAGEPAEQADVRFFRADGSELWGLLSATAIRADDGRHAGTLAMITDITARRLAERALRESSARMASIFDAVTNGLLVLDGDGRIVESNAAAGRLLAHAADAGGLWSGVREDGSAVEPADHPVRRALATGEPVRDVVMGVRQPDGALNWLSVNAEPIHGAHGAVALVVASLTDISYRKRSEDALR